MNAVKPPVRACTSRTRAAVWRSADPAFTLRPKPFARAGAGEAGAGGAGARGSRGLSESSGSEASGNSQSDFAYTTATAPRLVIDGGADSVLIEFQNGPINEVGVNGVTHEALLSILCDRMRGFQAGPYASADNAEALACMEQAQTALQRRTKARMARGVEGTHTV